MPQTLVCEFAQQIIDEVNETNQVSFNETEYMRKKAYILY